MKINDLLKNGNLMGVIPTRVTPALLAMIGLMGLISCQIASSEIAEEASAIPDYRTYGSWHSSRISGGGYMINVVPSRQSPSRLYAYSDVGGAFRSEDEGLTWTMIHGDLPGVFGAASTRGLIVDPRDDSRLVILVGNHMVKPLQLGVFVSEDAGETWYKTLDADTDGNDAMRAGGFVLVRDPGDADHVLVVTNGGGIYESWDNASTWTKLGLEGIRPVHVLIDESDSKRWWVAAKSSESRGRSSAHSLAGGLYYTEDGGGTWDQLQKSADTPTEFVQDPSDPQRLVGITRDYRLLCESWDAGQSWQPLNDGLNTDLETKQLPTCSLYQYRALTAGPDFLLTANTHGDVFRLEAGGSRWEAVIPQMNVDNDLTWWGEKMGKFGLATAALTVSPHDPNHWYLTDFLSVFQTRDAGAHWIRSTEGIENTVVVGLAQDVGNPSRVHAALADIGYLRSEDGAENFYVMKGLGYKRNTSLDRNCKVIAVSPANPKRVYATATKQDHWQVNQLYISEDSGVSWEASPMIGLPIGQAYACSSVAVDPENPNHIIVGVSGPVALGRGGVYRSVDGGVSFEWIGEGLPTDQRFFLPLIFKPSPDLAISADGSMVCYTSDAQGLFYFDASEQKWVESTLVWMAPASVRAVLADPHNPGRFYLGLNENGLYRSDNGGQTWEHMGLPSASGIALDQVNAGKIAVTMDDGVFYSQDDGETWTELDRRLPVRNYRNTLAFAGDRILVGTRGSGIFWMTLPDAE